MSATKATKDAALKLLQHLSVLPADRREWGLRNGLKPAETDEVFRRAGIKPTS